MKEHKKYQAAEWLCRIISVIIILVLFYYLWGALPQAIEKTIEHNISQIPQGQQAIRNEN